MPMVTFGTANAAALNTTSPAFSFGIGAYMAGLTSINRQQIDVANVQIVLNTSKIAIFNVVDGTQYDDFTQAETLNTALWNTAFSLDNNPPSVVLVTSNTPIWVNWTIPDDGFGLATKANLADSTVPWYSPGY